VSPSPRLCVPKHIQRITANDIYDKTHTVLALRLSYNKIINWCSTFRWYLTLAHQVRLVGDKNNNGIHWLTAEIGSSDIIAADVTACLRDVINEWVRPLIAESISHWINHHVRISVLNDVIVLSHDVYSSNAMSRSSLVVSAVAVHNYTHTSHAICWCAKTVWMWFTKHIIETAFWIIYYYLVTLYIFAALSQVY